MMRKATLLGLGLLAQVCAPAQTNRHNNLGQEESLWKMKRISVHEFIAVGNNGTVEKYNDSCNDWLPLPLNTNTEDFRNLSFPTAATGYISGLANAFYKTTNGGASWTSIPPAATGLSNASIQCVHFRNNDTGFIAGSQTGTGSRFIKKTTDGGMTWTSVAPANIGTSTVYDMAFFDAETGIAVATGNKAFRTMNNGDTWTAITTPGAGYAVAVAGAHTAIAVASANIMRTTDQGLTWTAIPTTATGLQGVHFYDTLHGMITGAAGTLLYTSDAGLNWTSIATLLSQKLYDVQMTGPAKAVAAGASGIAIDVDLNQPFHRLFEEHFCHPQDSSSYIRYLNTDNSGAAPARKWFFTNVNETGNGLIAAQWFPGNFAIYDAAYYEEVLLQHHKDSARIVTPALDFSGTTRLALEWNEAFSTHPGGLSRTRIEGFNGVAWVKLYESTGADLGDSIATAVFPDHKRAIDISVLAGVANAKLRFYYIAPNTNDGLKDFWAISDIVISNRSVAVQLDSFAAMVNAPCIPVAVTPVIVYMNNTGDLPVFPLELAWSSSDGQQGTAGAYALLDTGATTAIALTGNFMPPAGGGPITFKAWIQKLPDENAGNDTLTTIFNFVPDPAGTDLLGNDTTLCNSSTLVLNAPVLDSLTWSDGSSGATLTATAPGSYWISGKTGSCTVSDTLRVFFASITAPAITRQDNILKTTTGYATYQWYKDNVLLPNATANELIVTQQGAYTVTVSTAEGCSATSSGYSYSGNGTGIDVITGENVLTIYPNPAGSYVDIKIEQRHKEPLELDISDLAGKRIVQTGLMPGDTAARIDISTLTPGIYFIKICGAVASRVTKLFKK